MTGPDLDSLFDRWQKDLADLDERLVLPEFTAGRAPSERWRVELLARTERLAPLMLELVEAFRQRLDQDQRGRLVELVATHSMVIWQLPSLLQRYLDRYANRLADEDFEVLAGLLALCGARVHSGDFTRQLDPWHHDLQRRGVDVSPLFEAALELTDAEDATPLGTRALFEAFRNTQMPDE